MIERPNRAALNKALDAFRDAMRPVIVRGMRRVRGKTVENAIYDSLSSNQANQFQTNLENNSGNIEGSIDIGDFPNLVCRNWRHIFSQQFGDDMNVQSLLYIITQARNKASHPSTEDLDTEYTRVVLYHIVDVLGKINAPEVKRIVEGHRDKLFKPEPPQMFLHESPDDSEDIPKSKSVKLKPWREVIPPNIEVTQDTFQEAELAANLQEVYDGRASETSYGNPVSFFKQTYVTEGMQSLLVDALKRLGGNGGPPVIQMQTGFGGGKTHSLIALYHIANSIDALANIPTDGDSTETQDAINKIIKKAKWDMSAGIQPKVAVLDGTYLAPTDADKTKEKGDPLNTLWGVMAYQLGGQEAYDMIREAAIRQESAPLGAQLDKLFEHIGPCVILIDELVAYLLNVVGDFLDVNYTFIQALSESARRSNNVVLVATLPKSQREVGDRGVDILAVVAKRLGRIETIWKPLETNEAFKVVRRRLFGDKIDKEERNRTCKAFLHMYNQNKKVFPQGVHETRYRKRMEDCYPIHPEVFDRLHLDWSGIQDFQETRGVLRLMANWVSRLYRQVDSPLIMPANLPLDDPVISSEFDKLMSGRWSPVFTEADNNGSGADLIDLSRNSFSEYGGAARRIARTVFLGSCPGRSLVGIDVKRIYLGVAQPGWHKISIYTEVLNEMRDSLYYFYSDEDRYYFHTEENLNKVAIDRANELSSQEINKQIIDEVGKAVVTHRSKVIICPADLDAIPDSNNLRVVILPPDKLLPSRSSEKNGEAISAAEHILTKHANRERTYRNTLLFLAAKTDAIRDLRDPIAKYLAWRSITQGDRRIDPLEDERFKQAQASLRKAGESIRSLIPKAYRWAIAPAQLDPEHTKYSMSPEQTQILDDGDIVKSAFETFITLENVIEYENHESLDEHLREYIWKNNDHISIHDLWNMMTQYVYMPRLLSRDVLIEAIKEGIEAGTFGYAEYYDAEQQNYQDMCFGEALPALDMNGLIVKPEIARRKPSLSLDSLAVVLQKSFWDDGQTHIAVKNVWGMLPAHVEVNQLQQQTLLECIQQGVLQGVFGYAVENGDEKIFYRETVASDTAMLEGVLVEPKKASTFKDQKRRGAINIVAQKNFEGEPSLDEINSLCQEIISPLRADGGGIRVEFKIIAQKEEGFSQNIERSVKANSAELDVEVEFNNQQGN